MLVDLTSKNIAGKPAAQALDRAGIVANYNAIPFDPRKPFDPSGLRIGTPAVTSRGMGTAEMKPSPTGSTRSSRPRRDEALHARIAGEVKELCQVSLRPGSASDGGRRAESTRGARRA